MNHALAIVQPGLSIRMTQPYYKVSVPAMGWARSLDSLAIYSCVMQGV